MEALEQVAKRPRKRSRVAQEVIHLAQSGVCIALIAKQTGLTKEAVRSILARAGLSLRALRAERAARRRIEPHSPAAQLLAQAADTVAVAEIRAAIEKRRPVHGDWEPALRAQGFPVPRRQARRAAAAVLAELRAQATAARGHQVVVVVDREQERAVRTHLETCGIAETGVEYYGARLVSIDDARKKYLVPAAALEALREAAAAAEEEDEWID